jgi:hypothetical protein
LVAYHPEKFSARASFSKKNLSSDGHFERPFSFMAMTEKYETEKEINSTTPASTKRKE